MQFSVSLMFEFVSLAHKAITKAVAAGVGDNSPPTPTKKKGRKKRLSLLDKKDAKPKAT